MDADKRDLLVSLLSEWRGKPLVLEFQLGISHICGICVLLSASESQLHLQFDRSSNIVCTCSIQLDNEIESVTDQEFEQAAESILGKRLATFTTEERTSFLSNSAERVINVRF